MSDTSRHRAPLDQERVTEDVLTSFKTTEPTLAWMQVMAHLRFARIVHAAVKLGIFESLRGHSRTADDVARATRTDAVSVGRLLRALSVAGLLAESDPGLFAIAPGAAVLLRDSRPPLGEALLDFFEPSLVPLDGLVRTLQTGRPAFEEYHGLPFYEYIAREASAGAAFDHGMNCGAVLRSHALLAVSDLSAARTIVDVGGGDGFLLASVLVANDHLRGVLLERAETAARARRRLAAAGLQARCEVADGDFFSAVPSGGDVYVLSFILHNWDDAACVALLSQCRRAMNDAARLVIIEQVGDPAAAASMLEYHSLPNLELLSGRERSEAEFRAILDAAGFALARTVRLREVPFSILEASLKAPRAVPPDSELSDDANGTR